MLAENLLAGQAEELIQRLVQLALDGDPTALRLAIERVYPAPKDRPLRLDKIVSGEITLKQLPEITTMVLEAVAEGQLAPSEGLAVTALVEAHRKVLEFTTVEERLSAIEARLGGGK